MIRKNLKSSGWRASLIATGCGFALVAGCTPTEVSVTVKPADLSASAETVAQTPVASAAGDGPTEVAAAGGFGDLAGTIVFDGAPGTLAPLVAMGADVRDKEVCAAKVIPDESLEVDSATKGVRNVYVYLEKPPAGAPPAPAADARIEFDQIGCKFIPHALTVRTKQQVFVLNSDAVAHNTHTFPNRNSVFNQAIRINEKEGVPFTYSRPEQVPVEVKCDFHPWMRAFHLPLEHQFAALTDEQGKFEIKGLPAGSHSFRIWHEKGGLLDRAYKATVKADAKAEVTIAYGAAKFAAFDGPRPQQVVVTPARLSGRK